MPSQPQPIQVSGAAVDLSSRVVTSVTVAASPAGATQTIVASITIPSALVVAAGIELLAVANLTVGTNGVSTQWRIRRTDTSGTVIADSGAVSATAANLVTVTAAGIDSTVGTITLPGQVYVATLTVASGSAASTVSSVYLRALVI